MPGNAVAIMRVRVCPGLNRLTRTLVVAHFGRVSAHQCLERGFGDGIGSEIRRAPYTTTADVMNTARPASACLSSGSRVRMSCQLAVTLTANHSSQSFGSMWPSGDGVLSMPALPTSTSRRP